MIRQAHSYLAGAVSGAALIAVSVVVFLLLLVSTQGFRDLPVVDLGRGESAAVAPARPASQSASAAAESAGARADAGGGGATADAGGAGTVTDGSRETSPSSGSPGAAVDSPPRGTPVASTGGRGRSGSNRSGGGGAAERGSSVSGTVSGAVNDMVDGVDRALGGALGRTGAPGVIKGTVDRVAGPNSVTGQKVDEAGGAVRGLLGDDD